MRTPDIVKLTGYARTTVNSWCTQNLVQHFVKGRMNCVPKMFLAEFFSSLPFRSITRKTKWHVQTLRDFRCRNEKLLSTLADETKEAENGSAEQIIT